MSFDERFNRVWASLVNHVNELVRDGYASHYATGLFGEWLNMDADMELGHGYDSAFKAEFGDLVTSEISSKLWMSGKNLIYAIKTFMFIKQNQCEINELIDFVEHFVEEQLSEFHNDYDEHISSLSSLENDEDPLN
jgi:hypothetical protein